MQHSDDEDDFLSADEDGFDGEQDEGNERKTQTTDADIEPSREAKRKPSNAQKIEDTGTRPTPETEPQKETSTQDDAPVDKLDVVGDGIVPQSSDQQDKRKCSGGIVSENLQGGTVANNADGEEDEDDEEALAERIRERNLKIARKFSAEIAKNLKKASAPIPVKTSASSTCDIDYPSIPGTPGSKSSSLPPAPPSTPALSSSFNNLNDQAPHQTDVGAAPIMNSQYSWRVPPTKQVGGSSSPASSKVKSETHARQVLDRLADKLSHTDKNLFERVTDDIKKVSIRNEEMPAISSVPSQLPLSSITDLGSTLGGWGWSGATKLLSSASQVTSHVGSVLDSVLQPEERVARPPEGNKSSDNKADATTEQPEAATSRHANASAQGDDAMPGDPLVDFTLNAMESLGKRAFGVMTTRDESGSLQIKGLGRPWEHLLSSKRANDSDAQNNKSDDVRDELRKNRSSPPRSPLGGKNFDTFETHGSMIEQKDQIDEPQLPSSLKNRRKRRDD